MITTLVKTDTKRGSQRITIPKIIRKIKHWENMSMYKIRILDDGTVTIEEYLTDDDLR
jgi:hypothetical protein